MCTGIVWQHCQQDWSARISVLYLVVIVAAVWLSDSQSATTSDTCSAADSAFTMWTKNIRCGAQIVGGNFNNSCNLTTLLDDRTQLFGMAGMPVVYLSADDCTTIDRRLTVQYRRLRSNEIIRCTKDSTLLHNREAWFSVKVQRDAGRRRPLAT